MYRYIVDDVITYTPDDLILFREAPFAVWMERLTLENPEHGIPPDLDSIASYHSSSRPDPDIVATLRVEGRNVILIDSRQEEPVRRSATQEAMRAGADFIVSGQIAVGNLSGEVDLLMRTSGFSELGDFLYIPCDTCANKSLQSAFRLSFAADLLASLQGQLPPQMLVIRDGEEVIPLQTDDNIYYYRAVQKRFLNAMREFRKHRMPDPAESAHFGRWAECAGEVLKQRASADLQREERQQQDETADQLIEELPQLRVASGAGSNSHYDRDAASRPEFSAAKHAISSRLLESTVTDRGDSAPTLAEQALLLAPGSYRNGIPPGHTPNLARLGKPRIVAAETPDRASIQRALFSANETPVHRDAGLPSTLITNVETLGDDPVPATDHFDQEIGAGEAMRPAPPPTLRVTVERQSSAARGRADVVHLPELEPRPPVFLPPDSEPKRELDFRVSAPGQSLNTQVREYEESVSSASSVVDMDRAPTGAMPPVVQRAEAVFERLLSEDPLFAKSKANVGECKSAPQDSELSRHFSSSLKTSEEFNDG